MKKLSITPTQRSDVQYLGSKHSLVRPDDVDNTATVRLSDMMQGEWIRPKLWLIGNRREDRIQSNDCYEKSCINGCICWGWRSQKAEVKVEGGMVSASDCSRGTFGKQKQVAGQPSGDTSHVMPMLLARVYPLSPSPVSTCQFLPSRLVANLSRIITQLPTYYCKSSSSLHLHPPRPSSPYLLLLLLLLTYDHNTLTSSHHVFPGQSSASALTARQGGMIFFPLKSSWLHLSRGPRELSSGY